VKPVPGKRRGWIATVLRLLREAWLPLVLAGGYSAWDSYSSPAAEKTWTHAVSKFGAGLFFFMWLFGQFIRVAKQLRVEGDLEQILDGVKHIEDALSRLPPPGPGPAAPATTPLPATPAPQPAEVTGRALMTEAEAAEGVGAHRAALMVAGAALEESIREFARSRGLTSETSAPITRVLAAARPVLGADVTDELLRLWSLRNQVVHGAVDERTASSLSPEILAATRKVVGMLLEASRVTKYTGVHCPRCGNPSLGSGGAENTCGICGFTSDEG
jgi:uncharacterized protein YutE (UPF0331/DUF86 family)